MKDEEALDRLLAKFEAGTLPNADWTHATHLRVATCYLLAHSHEETLGRLRVRIRFLNDCHGTLNSEDSGYHETLTRFWLSLLGRLLGTLPRETPRATAVEAVVLAFGERSKLYERYYTFDLVKDRTARRSWVAPDKEPLDWPLPGG